jgi:FtsZ-interacting cell division protein ZipA
MGTVIVIIIVIVVIAAVLGFLAMRRNSARQVESQRAEAQELREQASQVNATTVRKQEAEAAEVEAKARMARAEADAKAAQAEQYEVNAQGQSQSVERSREEVDQKLTRADEIDPDIDTERHSDSRTE